MVQFLKSQKFGQNLCLKSRKQSAKEGAFKLYFLPVRVLGVIRLPSHKAWRLRRYRA
jgi:hypothetical protein